MSEVSGMNGGDMTGMRAYAAFARGRLYYELETFMNADGPMRYAYDGVLWEVRSGEPLEVPDTILEGVDVTVLRNWMNPAVYRVEVSHPEGGRAGFMYDFAVLTAQAIMPGSVANYTIIHQMVGNTIPDSVSTEVNADHITALHEITNPEVQLPSIVEEQFIFDALTRRAA